MSAQNDDQKVRKELEIRKLELMVKIKELELDLERTNFELYRRGVDIQTAMCW